MNAIRLLLRQHDEIEALLKNLAKSDEEGPRARQEYLRLLTIALHAHLYIEEEIFYPAIAEQGVPALVERSYREHERCRELLNALKDASPEQFMDRLRALEDAVVQHAGDEEVDLFPEVKSLFGGAELEELGARLEEAREQFINAPMAEARAPDETTPGPPPDVPDEREQRPESPEGPSAGTPT
ncbi:MAG: hemerythrin domain-containing protein [Myxococcales bacterium]